MPRCLFNLYDQCIVLRELVNHHKNNKALVRRLNAKWGSPEWVRIYCAMCMKSVYAKAHLNKSINIRVVNTL